MQLSSVQLFVRRPKYLQKGMIALMNPTDDPRSDLVPGVPASSEEMNQLKTQIQDLQMQVDILKET